MKHKKFRVLMSSLLVLAMLFALNTMSYAATAEENTSKPQFGDVLYADDEIAVFYGNPNENESTIEAATAIEAQAQTTRSLRHDYIWVNANTTTDKHVDIYASSDQPISYVNVKQESQYAVPRSRIDVRRPDNKSYCLVLNWDGQKTIQSNDIVVSSTVLWTESYPRNVVEWTSGYIRVGWDVETGSSGARLNVWVW